MKVIKALFHRGQDPQLYFWRTSGGREADLVVDRGGQLIPIEISLASTPHPGLAAGITGFREALGQQVAPDWLVHPGDTQLTLGLNVRSLPFADL